ncbi:MAG TPA: mobile mystery protein A [Streptosporangiaceae bacterium]|nr:mobile mystery protein A [Streptosporangiaceae bacterium]
MPRVSNQVSRRSRELLDSHFDEWQQLRGLARPPRGWIRAVREALGMSAAALAARLGVTAGAVTRLEQSEAAERIRLDTLRRTADALGCDLVYLLVPRRPLTAVVRDRARDLAHRQIAAVEQTMRLEDQATGTAKEMEDQLTEQLLERGGLWSQGAHE